eukprot:4278580-Prymnesium_polylepis.1
MPQPAWFDLTLRSATLGNGRALPAGVTLNGGGLLLTLPTSPVYASEAFDGFLYAHTGGFALNSMTVSLMYDRTLLEYVSYQQTSHFNGAVFEASDGRLAWVITGRSSAATTQDVTGEAIYLLTVRLRFRSATAAGEYSGAGLNVYPIAFSLVNNANLAFVENAAGSVCSSGDTPSAYATLSVQAAHVVGIMSAAQAPVLFNTAVFDGQVSEHRIVVDEVGSSDLVLSDTSSTVVTACAADSPVGAMSAFSLAVS